MGKIAQGGFTIRKIIDGKTLSFSLTANTLTQFNQQGSSQYTPNFGSQPLIITPNLSVSGMTGNQMAGHATWTINGTASGSFSGASTQNDYSLKITANMTSVDSYRIVATYVYTDPDTQKTNTVSANILIIKQIQNANSIDINLLYLNGDTYYLVNGVAQTKAFRATLIRGGEEDTSNVTYSWRVYNSSTNTYDIIAYGASGYSFKNVASNGTATDATTNNARQIEISSNNVLNVQNFCVVITDSDSSSPTSGNTVTAYFSLKDQTDPYVLTAKMYNGDSVTSVSDVPVVFSVEQYGEEVPTSFYNNKTIKFFRYTATGTTDTTFVTALSSGDFSGWSKDTTNGYVFKTFGAAANPAAAARTANFGYSHVGTGKSSAGFGIILEG